MNTTMPNEDMYADFFQVGGYKSLVPRDEEQSIIDRKYLQSKITGYKPSSKKTRGFFRRKNRENRVETPNTITPNTIDDSKDEKTIKQGKNYRKYLLLFGVIGVVAVATVLIVKRK